VNNTERKLRQLVRQQLIEGKKSAGKCTPESFLSEVQSMRSDMEDLAHRMYTGGCAELASLTEQAIETFSDLIKTIRSRKAGSSDSLEDPSKL